MTIIFTVDVETWQPIPDGKKIDWDVDVINPLLRLCILAKNNNQKLVLMVETEELLWLKVNNWEKFKEISIALGYAHAHGNELGLHIHPAWRDAELVDGTVQFGKHQHILDYPFPYRLTKDGVELIKDICGESPISFRACKYQICRKDTQNWEQMYNYLKDVGIKIDSSVWPGQYMPEHWVDFRGCAFVPYYPDINDISMFGKQKDIKEYPIAVMQGGRFDLNDEFGRYLELDFSVRNVAIGHTKLPWNWDKIEHLLKTQKLTTFREEYNKWKCTEN